jgi:hypothetical protein
MYETNKKCQEMAVRLDDLKQHFIAYRIAETGAQGLQAPKNRFNIVWKLRVNMSELHFCNPDMFYHLSQFLTVD